MLGTIAIKNRHSIGDRYTGDRFAIPLETFNQWKRQEKVMLVLSRRLAETLRIGDDIEITVIGVSGNQVRLGIVAPRDVVVDREEVHQRKKAGIPHPNARDRDENETPKPVITRANRGEMRTRLFGRSSK